MLVLRIVSIPDSPALIKHNFTPPHPCKCIAHCILLKDCSSKASVGLQGLIACKFPFSRWCLQHPSECFFSSARQRTSTQHNTIITPSDRLFFHCICFAICMKISSENLKSHFYLANCRSRFAGARTATSTSAPHNHQPPTIEHNNITTTLQLINSRCMLLQDCKRLNLRSRDSISSQIVALVLAVLSERPQPPHFLSTNHSTQHHNQASQSHRNLLHIY